MAVASQLAIGCLHMKLTTPLELEQWVCIAVASPLASPSLHIKFKDLQWVFIAVSSPLAIASLHIKLAPPLELEPT